MSAKPRETAKPDYILLFSLALLVLWGLVMLASASSNLGKIKFDDSYYYLKHQLIFGLSLGLIGFFIASRFYYRSFKKLALPLLLINIVLLILVFTPLGFRAGGADRWLSIGSFTFQPSELLKVTFIIYLAAWLGEDQRRSKSIVRGLIPFLILAAIIGGLLIKQPATSTVAILMAAALAVYFVSGAKMSHVVGIILLGAVVLTSVIYITPYRFNRIMSFVNPEANPLGSGYHLNQARIAIGSGGLLGVGYGQSTTKVHYLPEPIGDSIFAVIAEELGFVGAMITIALFLSFILRTLLLAKETGDRFAQLLLIGFAVIIALQAFVNIAAISGLIPLTGTPLPFISFGGTALAVFMTMGGIIINVSKYR